jgi:hypothetical protein
VSPVAKGEVESGDGCICARSASPTPPPAASQSAASQSLADHVTEMRLRGEEPGVRDGDTLLSGEEEDNTAAIENEAKRGRDRVKQTVFVKSKATEKAKATADNTDSDSPGPERDPKRKRESGSGSKMTATPHNGKKKGRGKATEQEIVLDSDEEEEEARASTTRHVGVARSTIYMTFRGFIELIRSSAQFLLLNRDGWPIQAGTQNRA